MAAAILAPGIARPIVTRKEAQAQGLKRFFNGKPCKRGHIAERFLDGTCLECQRLFRASAERKVYMKTYNAKPESRAAKKAYMVTPAGKACMKAYNAKPTTRAAKKAYMVTPAGMEIRVITRHKRRALEKAGAKGLSRGLSAKLLLAQRGRCAVCSIKIVGRLYHLDHIVPLVRGGLNVDSNIQIACIGCNCAKGGKDPINFMQERGFLL